MPNWRPNTKTFRKYSLILRDFPLFIFILVCISDNLTTGMTGGQDSAGTGRLEAICEGLGVDPRHIRVIVPLPKNYPDMEKVIREEIEYHGVSVIISRRECIQTLKRHAKK